MQHSINVYEITFMTKSDNSKYHVPNLERALKILEHLTKHPAGLSIAQITEDLKISRNSVFRISSTLIDNGYLLRDGETKVLQLSTKLLDLGYAALGEQTLVEKSLGVMRELRDKYGETVPLGILHGNVGLVIEEVPGTYSFRFVLEPGRIFKLHTSAPGKAMLAFLPEEERERLINQLDFKRYNERTITNADEYRKVLVAIRQKGYAVDIAEEIEGMHCIGAPIFNRRGYPIAAIWITGPSFRIREEDFMKIGEALKVSSTKISKSFGYNYLRLANF